MEGFSLRACSALADDMRECYEQLDDGTAVVRFLHLGSTHVGAVRLLMGRLAEADPDCGDGATRLLSSYERFSRRQDVLCTPESFRRRDDAGRLVIEATAGSMSLRLGGTFLAFETINPALTFAVRSARPLVSEHAIVGIAEVRPEEEPPASPSQPTMLSP